MSFSRVSSVVAGASIFFVGGYLATLLFPGRAFQTEARDLLECVVPLFANACLLSNATSPHGKQNAFWKLVALSCTLLLAGRLIHTYDEFVLRNGAQNSFLASFFPFLHMMPLVAALALVPHRAEDREGLGDGVLDLTLLAGFWIYLYAYSVLPWEIIRPDGVLFHQWNVAAFLIQTLVVLVGFGVLFVTTKGAWRIVYGQVLAATALYGLGALTVFELELRDGEFIRGLCYVASLVWLGAAALLARKLPLAPSVVAKKAPGQAGWLYWLPMLTVLSFPLFGGWAVLGGAPAPVRAFRLAATLVATFICAALVFFRQHLAHEERQNLVLRLSASLENVSRLQTQFVRSEKLAALGQLAAGAAHEINNPLTAIVGYSDLLLAENAPATRAYTLGEKIQEQARRTKSLVANLLSFARQVPAEKQLLDLQTVLDNAVQLRKIDVHNKNIRIELESRNSVLPAVRGDPNQLLQVFYHLIGNAADAMETIGGGVLLIRALSERGTIIVEFSDTGPGMKDPEKAFDPFYTTKPVGKGTGLGLSICYNIMQEHGGSITGFNRPEGGCTFRLELPAALASLPRVSATPLSQRAH